MSDDEVEFVGNSTVEAQQAESLRKAQQKNEVVEIDFDESSSSIAPKKETVVDDVEVSRPPGLPRALNLQRLLQDVVAVLTPEARKAFQTFARTLKTKRDSGLIPSLSEALMRDGPAVVGVDIWNEAVAKQQ